ncbi:MAG: peptidylprolyl isomerase [Bryobacter sp.]|nr:peptidylprolyl isomerase [Bryobacter sp.]
MRSLLIIFVLGATLFAQEPNSQVMLRFETEAGNFTVALNAAKAPATTRNFLRYVDAGLYDNGVFHRTVKTKAAGREDNQPQSPIKIDVVQGGKNPARPEGFPAIALERTSETGLRHEDGTLSMARSGPDTATSDFFFCLGNQPSLDFGGKRNPDGQGFAAFGKVVSGRAVLDKIQLAPAEGQRLVPPIRILKVMRIP